MHQQRQMTIITPLKSEMWNDTVQAHCQTAILKCLGSSTASKRSSRKRATRKATLGTAGCQR